MHTLFLKSDRIPRGGNENFREMKSLAKDSNALFQETEGVRAPESRRHRELRWSCQFLRCWNILSYVVNGCLEPLECPVWFLLTSTSATQPSDPPTDLPTLQNDGLQASAPAEWPETAPVGPLLLWVLLQYSFASTCWRVEPQNWKVCTHTQALWCSIQRNSQPQGYPPSPLECTPGIVFPGLRETPPHGKWE